MHTLRPFFGFIAITVVLAAADVSAATFIVTSTADDGPGTLREAVGMANAAAGFDEVRFEIASPPYVIQTETSIEITDPVRIDGYSQAGASRNTLAVGTNAILLVEVAPGFDVFARFAPPLVVGAGGSQSEISGLVVRGYFTGLQVLGATGVKIAGNYIGTDAGGATAMGNNTGVDLAAGASGNQIGGTSPGDRNVISGNGAGILVSSPTATSNLIIGNYIGTNAAGTAAVANGIGLRLTGAGANNTIGHAGAGNVISGNGTGILINSGSRNVSVLGNCIGAAAGCTASAMLRRESNASRSPETLQGAGSGVPNGDGIRVEKDNSGGGTPSGIGIGSNDAGNVIASNTLRGIVISDAQGTSVINNDIFSNGSDGILMTGALVLGGNVQENDIHDNGGDGIRLDGGSDFVVIGGGSIQRNSNGLDVGPGNTNVFLTDAIIIDNSDHGVLVAPGADVEIGAGSISDNGGLGIDYGGNGVTPNDLPDLDPISNYPEIDSATFANANVTVYGFIDTSADEIILIQFYQSSVCDPSGSGEGQRFLCETQVLTDLTGHAEFTATCSGANGGFITATATRESFGTSEFSTCTPVTEGGSIPPDPSLLSINSVSTTEAATAGPGAALNFTVTVSPPSDSPITVQFEAIDGTATAGQDYVATSGTLEIPPHAPSATIPVTILGDTVDELEETFFVTLSNAVGATIADGEGQGTIADDDAIVTISIIGSLTFEGSGGSTTPALFTVTLSKATSQIVTVSYNTSPGSASGAGVDYEDAAGVLVFAPGEAVKVVTVPLRPDLVPEADETFFVNLFNAVNATIAVSRGTATIIDDDEAIVPTLSIVPAVRDIEGRAAFTFNVTLSPASNNPVSVSYFTSDRTATAGNDYLADEGSVSFAPGVTERQIVVRIVDDGEPEEDETFDVTLHSPENAQITRGVSTATIIDDDAPPRLTIEPVTVFEGTQQGPNAVSTVATFTVVLTPASDEVVFVSYETVGRSAVVGEDFADAQGTLVFAPGESVKRVEVSITPDSKDETDEEFVVTLSDAIGAVIAGNGSATGTITDDDESPAPYTVEIGANPEIVAPGETTEVAVTTTNTGSETVEGPLTTRLFLSGEGATFAELPTTHGFQCASFGAAGQFIACVANDAALAAGAATTTMVRVRVSSSTPDGTTITVTATTTSKLHSVSAGKLLLVRSKSAAPRLTIEQTVARSEGLTYFHQGRQIYFYDADFSYVITNRGDASTEGPIRIEIRFMLPDDASVDVPQSLPDGWSVTRRSTGERVLSLETSDILDPGETLTPPTLGIAVSVTRGAHFFTAEVSGGGSPPSVDSDQLIVDPRQVLIFEEPILAIIQGRSRSGQ